METKEPRESTHPPAHSLLIRPDPAYLRFFPIAPATSPNWPDAVRAGWPPFLPAHSLYWSSAYWSSAGSFLNTTHVL